MKRAALTLASLAVILGLAAEARAVPPILAAPSGRPFEGYGGLGGAFDVKASAAHQFKLIAGFAWHFFGQPHGPAVALELQPAFGSSFFTFIVGPKFKWDFQIIKDLALYIAPYLQLGYQYSGSNVCIKDPFSGQERCESGGGSAFNLQFGAEGKLILAQRGVVFFRPLQLNFGIASSTAISYDLIVGGGVIF
jgi:hypothetical protein